MTAPKHRLPVDIRLKMTLLTAMHIGTGFGLARILDEVTVQGAHPDYDGADVPYIPGSSLKGRLRYHVRCVGAALRQSLSANNLDIYRAAETHLFGFEQIPGSLMFGDAYLENPLLLLGSESESVSPTARIPYLIRSERSFVSLSPQRRVALEDRLFSLEITDNDLVFCTTIMGALPGADESTLSGEAQAALALLLAAARDLTHLGGHKGRGLGACRIEIEHVRLDGTDHAWKHVIKDGIAVIKASSKQGSTEVQP